jgi:enoyl-CoA hydratase/carnithine racemase
MSYLDIQHADGVATVRMSRGKVNALDGEMVAELHSAFGELAGRADVVGAVLTDARTDSAASSAPARRAG